MSADCSGGLALVTVGHIAGLAAAVNRELSAAPLGQRVGVAQIYRFATQGVRLITLIT